MNNKFFSVVLALMFSFSYSNAEAAKRMGSGTSVGQQSNNVSQTQGAKPAQNATPATPAAAPAAAPQSRPWGAMLGGLAAGLGLAIGAGALGLAAATCFHTNFLPDLLHMYFTPAVELVCPAFLQAAPAFTAALALE